MKKICHFLSLFLFFHHHFNVAMQPPSHENLSPTPPSTNLRRCASRTDVNATIVTIPNINSLGPSIMEQEYAATRRLQKILCPCMAGLTCLGVAGIITIAFLNEKHKR